MTDQPHISATKDIALVTGAGGGIGGAICRRLAADGYDVVAIDVELSSAERVVNAIGEQGASASAVVVDLRDEAATRALADRLPPVAVLVNNAGIFSTAAFADLTSDDFRRSYEVNLIGAFNLSQAVSNRMEEGARIVNISSRGAFGGANYAHYAASKAAVIGLTRTMAMELAARGITVNSIAPGAIDTTMVRSRPDIDVSGLLALQPIKRLGSPDDIANAVAFLASPQASYITGQLLLVDGGRSLGGPNGL